MNTWLHSYAVWSTALGLPPGHERVAYAVVREKIAQAVERREFKGVNPVSDPENE